MAADRDLALVARRELEHRATHDELTGLPGRALLFDRVQHAVDATERHQSSIAVLLMDVDHFKAIKDEMGHATGDVVLTEVARRVKSVLRSSDTLARLSGDEFVAVCEDLSTGEEDLDQEIAVIVSRIGSALGRPVYVAGHEVTVSVSVGVALASRDRSARDLIDTADQAMYRAKHEGRGLVVIRNPASAAGRG